MSKYPNHAEKTAKSADEAIALALEELHATREEVDIDIIQENSKGFLGLGAKDAIVSVSVKEPAIRAAKNFLSDIFSAMKIDSQLDVSQDGNNLNIDVKSDYMGIIIGKHGDTLDALQYLTALIVNQGSEDYIKVTIDSEDYRSKREEALITLAGRLADNVVSSGRKKILEPMSPYERRIIHSALQSNTDITTYSIGNEPYRKVVIAPKNPKPGYKKYYSRDRDYGYRKRRNYSSDYKPEADFTDDSDNEPSYE